MAERSGTSSRWLALAGLALACCCTVLAGADDTRPPARSGLPGRGPVFAEQAEAALAEGDRFLEQGRAEAALPRFREALVLSRRAGGRFAEISALDSLADALDATGQAKKATACRAQASAIERDLHPDPPGWNLFHAAVAGARPLFVLTGGERGRTLFLVLLFGTAATLGAARGARPALRWFTTGAGIGIAVFAASTAGLGWETTGRQLCASAIGAASALAVSRMLSRPAAESAKPEAGLARAVRVAGCSALAVVLLRDLFDGLSLAVQVARLRDAGLPTLVPAAVLLLSWGLALVILILVALRRKRRPLSASWVGTGLLVHLASLSLVTLVCAELLRSPCF